MKLVAASDKASGGVGAPVEFETEPHAYLLNHASDLRQNAGTLCEEKVWTCVRVLPRVHTPHDGLLTGSYRSTFRWWILPWPFGVVVRQSCGVTDSAPARLPESFGF